MEDNWVFNIKIVLKTSLTAIYASYIILSSGCASNQYSLSYNAGYNFSKQICDRKMPWPGKDATYLFAWQAYYQGSNEAAIKHPIINDSEFFEKFYNYSQCSSSKDSEQCNAIYLYYKNGFNDYNKRVANQDQGAFFNGYEKAVKIEC